MHKKIFLNAFRTALLIVLSFMVYEVNVKLLTSIQNTYPELHNYYYLVSKIIKFILVFILDIFILYIYAHFFNVVI
jgi:hypothetical protein